MDGQGKISASRTTLKKRNAATERERERKKDTGRQADSWCDVTADMRTASYQRNPAKEHNKNPRNNSPSRLHLRLLSLLIYNIHSPPLPLPIIIPFAFYIAYK